MSADYDDPKDEIPYLNRKGRRTEAAIRRKMKLGRRGPRYTPPKKKRK